MLSLSLNLVLIAVCTPPINAEGLLAEEFFRFGLNMQTQNAVDIAIRESVCGPRKTSAHWLRVLCLLEWFSAGHVTLPSLDLLYGDSQFFE